MPDISMCKDEACSKKATCYRFQASPNPFRQSYFMGSPRKESEAECDYYWPISPPKTTERRHRDSKLDKEGQR